jgi:hypothetical protein
VSNLMKYAQGVSPLEAGGGGAPGLALAGSGGARQAVVTLERNPVALGLTFTLETSADLMQWQRVDAVTVEEEPDRIRFLVEEVP